MSDLKDKQEKARKRKALFLQRNKRYEFSLPNKDALVFEKRANTKGYKPFAYLRKLIEADLNGTGFVTPTDTELIHLGRSITAIGKKR